MLELRGTFFRHAINYQGYVSFKAQICRNFGSKHSHLVQHSKKSLPTTAPPSPTSLPKTYIYSWVCTCMLVHVHAHMCIVHSQIYIHEYACACIHVYCVCLLVYVHVCSHVLVLPLCAFVYADMCTYTSIRLFASLQCQYVCGCALVQVCACVHAFVCVFIARCHRVFKMSALAWMTMFYTKKIR